MLNASTKKFFLLLSFIEGASVMATELLGAKMLSPYFGSSLYVWASVLAITLGGLAAGYFAGGIVSYKSKNSLTLFNVLIAAATFTILMPFTSKFILWAIGFKSLIPSVILATSVILLPPVFMMGMVSPLIIKAITTDIEQSGKASGTVYAISTLGGIIATFLFGFYIIPEFGLTKPCIATGIVLGIIPLFVILKKKYSNGIGFLFICGIAIWHSTNKNEINSRIKLLYSTEGLLGQIMVYDYTQRNDTTRYTRWLYVNKISQTMYAPHADESKNEEKYFTYVYRIEKFSDSLPKNANILLLGLGGGSIANVLSQKGFNVDVCELDKRIAYVAKKYFSLSEKVNINIDDARHFIKTCDKKYDLIIFDTFKGEDAPNHLFTTESFEETKKILNPNGYIIVNSFGYIDDKIGKSVRSIYKTFLSSGFNVCISYTEPEPDSRNLLFFASLNKVSEQINTISEKNIDLNDAEILSDNYPRLDVLNAEAAKRWRALAISSFNVNTNLKTLPVFN